MTETRRKPTTGRQSPTLQKSALKVSLHIRGLLRVFTPPETLHENALFALIDL